MCLLRFYLQGYAEVCKGLLGSAGVCEVCGVLQGSAGVSRGL